MTGLEDTRYALSWLVVNIQKPVNSTNKFTYDCVTDWQSNYTDNQFQCVVGNNGYSYYETGKLLNITIYNQRTGNISAPFPGISFKYLPPPHIDSVSGCDSVSADGQITFGCVPDRHSITLTGSGFSTLNGTNVRLNLGNSRWYEYVSGSYVYQYTFDLSLIHI